MRKTWILALALALAGPARASVSTTATTAGPYACSGLGTAFAVPFPFLEKAHLQVTREDLAGSVVTLSSPADFTVSSPGATGTVTLTSSAKCPDGYKLTIARVVPRTQPLNLATQGAYSPKAITGALDRVTMQTQELAREDLAVRADFASLEAWVQSLAAGGLVVAPKTWSLTGDGSSSSFTINGNEISDAASYTVAIDGILQRPGTDYTVSVTGHAIAFAEAPPYGSAIAVRCLTYAKASPAVLDGSTVTATGSTTARSLADRFADVVNAKDYGVKCDGAYDNKDTLTAFFDAVASRNAEGELPPGVCLTSADLTIAGAQATGYGKRIVIRGAGDAVDGDARGTTIKRSGTGTSANTLLKVNGVFKFTLRGVTLDGGGKVGKVFWATQAAGTFAPYGWVFEDVVFRWATDNGYAFYLDTTTDHARHRFVGCTFSTFGGVGPTIWTGTGFYSSNQNSLNNTFTNCNFQFNGYGYYLDGGSAVISGGEMTNNSVTDVYLNIHEAVTLINIHSEQSRQFLTRGYTDARGDLSATVIGCKIASNPWSFWKWKGGVQPPNDNSQWAGIYWDNDSPLVVLGSAFADPFLGTSAGGAAPTTSGRPSIYAPNALGTRIITTGSTSAITPADLADRFVYGPGGLKGGGLGILTVTSGATNAPDRSQFDFFAVTATNTTPVAIAAPVNAAAGQRIAFQVFNFNVAGTGVTFTWNAAYHLAGALPNPALSYLRTIEFIYNGNAWLEVARATSDVGPF